MEIVYTHVSFKNTMFFILHDNIFRPHVLHTKDNKYPYRFKKIAHLVYNNYAFTFSIHLLEVLHSMRYYFGIINAALYPKNS